MKPRNLETQKWKGIRTALLQFAIPVVLATASFAVSPAQLFNQGPGTAHGKIARDLDRSHPNKRVDVIVQFKMTPTAKHYQRMAARGARVKSRLHGINAAAFNLPVSALAKLEKDSDVVYVSPDRKVTLKDNSYEVFASAVEADIADQQYDLDGTGIGVAVIDSGIADHVDLHNANGSRVVYSESFVPGNTSGVDAYGHGTHVSGIIGGNGSGSGQGSGYASQITGIAPNVNIINLRVLDQNGAGTDSQVIAAIQRAIQLQAQYNIRVINLSLGRAVYESYTVDPLDQAAEQAWAAGIVVVVAAGNNGRDNSMHTHGFATIGSPGNDPAVITVGATRTFNTATRNDDAIASYSSKGPTLVDHIVKPDVVAPGNRIASLLVKNSTLDTTNPSLEIAPSGPCGPGCSNRYFRLSGTSMATPVVSGAVALMLQNDPTLTPDTVKARIMKTAWKGFGVYCRSWDVFNNEFDNQYDLFTYGAGYLNVDAALASTDVANGVALSPTAVFNPLNNSVSIVNTNSVTWGTSVLWGSSIVWGNSIIWGNSVLDANSIVWGNSVVWGNTVDTGFSIVWGNSIVWGSSTATSAYSDGQDGEN
ncbi:MAG TPA: S8 family serine peptidase [Terriglobales bacterium]|jgi:serine protease AprX|nr:S8 family serine peptidase [Terriglobales bacterium]